MTDRVPPALWLRLLALVTLVAGFVFFVRANDAEADAIFDAGGDAGLWSLGILVAALILSPGAILLMASLPLVLKPTWGAGLSVVAGLAVIVPTAWLAANVYPRDQRVGGVRLDPDQWSHVANLYLAAFVLLGLSSVFLLVSAHPILTSGRRTEPQLTPA